MISLASYATSRYCSNKIFEWKAAPLAICHVVAEVVVAALAALLFFKGVGVISASFVLASTVLIEICLASYFICKPENRVSIHIVEKNQQLERYRALPMIEGQSSYCADCDRFSEATPVEGRRVVLKTGRETNGAEIWDKDILIQGPLKANHIEQLWQIVFERDIQTIVRIGKDHGKKPCCTPYTPREGEPYVKPGVDGFSVYFKSSLPRLADKIFCTEYSLSNYGGQRRPVFHYSFESWPDHGEADCAEVFTLIKELEKRPGPVLIHCRGGIGRSGTFEICREVYKLYREAKRRGEESIEIDPAAKVKELRNFRAFAVDPSSSQFEMILSFIEYLNKCSRSGLI